MVPASDNSSNTSEQNGNVYAIKDLAQHLFTTRCSVLFDSYMKELEIGSDERVAALMYALEGSYEGITSMELKLLEKHLRTPVRCRNPECLSELTNAPLRGFRIWDCDGHVTYLPSGFRVVRDFSQSEEETQMGRKKPGKQKEKKENGPKIVKEVNVELEKERTDSESKPEESVKSQQEKEANLRRKWLHEKGGFRVFEKLNDDLWQNADEMMKRCSNIVEKCETVDPDIYGTALGWTYDFVNNVKQNMKDYEFKILKYAHDLSASQIQENRLQLKSIEDQLEEIEMKNEAISTMNAKPIVDHRHVLFNEAVPISYNPLRNFSESIPPTTIAPAVGVDHSCGRETMSPYHSYIEPVTRSTQRQTKLARSPLCADCHTTFNLTIQMENAIAESTNEEEDDEDVLIEEQDADSSLPSPRVKRIKKSAAERARKFHKLRRAQPSTCVQGSSKPHEE